MISNCFDKLEYSRIFNVGWSDFLRLSRNDYRFTQVELIHFNIYEGRVEVEQQVNCDSIATHYNHGIYIVWMCVTV